MSWAWPLPLNFQRKSCSGPSATYEATLQAGMPGVPAAFVKKERLTSVVNLGGRQVLISHGFSVPVAAGSSTNAFKGTPIEGKWELTADLLSGENCIPGGVAPSPGVKPPPPSLMLNIYYGCL